MVPVNYRGVLMPMSKKHFQAIADVISQTKKVNATSDIPTLSRARGECVLLQVALNLAEVCRRDNPAFDKGRFMSACGFESSK